MKCSVCAFDITDGARFCGGCGLLLQAADSFAPDAEKRRVCVLFCDLVGSTQLSRQLDPEDLRNIVGAYQRACEAAVLRHDGFVAQRRGDSVEVYFGYPCAHEDDAHRSVRCALDMLEAVRQLSVATDLDLKVRIGIDSGRVVVGSLGGEGRPERVAFGDTPNIAARAQAEAAPGEVIITESLWRLLEAAIEAIPMGPRPLKGIEQLISLYKVTSSGVSAESASAASAPFVGRVPERKNIEKIWALALEGVPQFVLLRGEPGIGKSRLIDVLEKRITDKNTNVLAMRCAPSTVAAAFQPVLDLIRSRLGLEGRPPNEQIVRIARRMKELGLSEKDAVPLLASILDVPIDPVAWPAAELSPARARQQLKGIIVQILDALTKRGSVLIVIEDLHWADPSSIELLQYAMRSLQSAHLMVLLTARPEFSPPWAAASNVTEIELQGLCAIEAETLIREFARNKPFPPDVTWQVRERGGGNPLFLEQITRGITESGAFVEREHAWELIGPLSSDVVPASIEASLMARIDRLGEARPLLQFAAALGREFSYDLLLAVAQMPEEAVRRHLLTILQAGLILRQSESPLVYVFKHALVRDAAYDSLLRTTRQRYHARIAEVLIGFFPEIADNRPDLLAHHSSGAGFFEAAAAHWQAAGENAAKRCAVVEAVRHLRRALADLERLTDDETRADRELSVLTSLAPVLMAAYGWAAPEVSVTCKRAIQLADHLEEKDRMYAPLWGLWTNEFVGGRLNDAMETAIKVLAMARATGDPAIEMTARHATSYTRYYRGEFDAAIAEANQGLKYYTAEREFAIVRTFQLSSSISSMTGKASSLWMKGLQTEGVALMEEMLDLAESLDHAPSMAAALAYAMMFNYYDRDWPQLFEMAAATYSLSQAEGFAMWAANAGMHRGRALIGLGEVEAGVNEVLEWGALFRQTGSGIIESSVTSMICEALHIVGRSDEALAVSVQGEQRAEQGFVRVMKPEVYRIRGKILRDLNRLDEADAAYCLAVECARAQGARSLEIRALTDLVDLRSSKGPCDNPRAELIQAIAGLPEQLNRADFLSARDFL